MPIFNLHTTPCMKIDIDWPERKSNIGRSDNWNGLCVKGRPIKGACRPTPTDKRKAGRWIIEKGGDSVPSDRQWGNNKGLRLSPIRGPFKTHLTTPTNRPFKPNQLTQQVNKSQVRPSVDCRWLLALVLVLVLVHCQCNWRGIVGILVHIWNREETTAEHWKKYLWIF